jgi:asparagine synthase (glutamine-hydrolysing)
VAEELETLLRDAVRLRLESDVPLGAFLSGGIDSSTVVALMQAQCALPVRTFTVGFREGEYDEAAEARRVARHLGTDHTEVELTPAEARAAIPRLAEVYDEPFADVSQLPTLLVSELARRQVTVALSGDGGDELFGGYNRHLWAERLWRGARRLPRPARGLLRRALVALPPRRWDALLGGLRRWLPRAARQRTPGAKLHRLAAVLDAPGPDALYRRLASHLSDPLGLVPGVEAEPPTVLDRPAELPALASLLDRMTYLDQVTYLPDDILTKLDRASMSVSLEARVPLLDHRVVELAWRLPARMKVRDGQGKWILRQVLYRHVPRTLVERPKAGFGVPIGEWLRGPLRPWAEDLLEEGRLRREGFLDPARVGRLWREHLGGRSSHALALWDVLMFEQWRAQTA